MPYFHSIAVVSTHQASALLQLDVDAARLPFDAFRPKATPMPGALRGVPMSCRVSGYDRVPDAELFGATMRHAPSFGAGVWLEYGSANDITYLDPAVANSLKALGRSDHHLEFHPLLYTEQLFRFDVGLRLRQAFWLAYEAGLLAHDPSVLMEGGLPDPENANALSIYLNRGIPLERIVKAAKYRARGLSLDARIALNGLLLAAERPWPGDRRQGLINWPRLMRERDLMYPEDPRDDPEWTLDASSPFAAAPHDGPERAQSTQRRLSSDEPDPWPSATG